jgi:hypothetical protein
VADAHVSAIERAVPGGEYPLGGENAPQIRLYQLLGEISGAPLPRRIPRPAAFMLAWMEEIVARAQHRPPRLTRGTVKILEHDWPLDIARSIEKLSYRVTSLKTGVKATVDSIF